jgi:CRISPR locus-related DNA-binding protein
MKTFIATLGWTEWPVASAIIKHGLSKGDRIILFTPEKKDDRSKVAVNEVKNFVSKFAPSVEVSEVPVPVHDPARGIIVLAGLIGKEAGEGRDLVVNLSGGMRVLVLETILALSLLHVGNLVLELQTEDKVELRLPRIWEVPQELSGHEARAIKALGEKSASLSDLAKALRISVATAHRLLKRLEARDAVLSKKVGKERIMELTEKGRILLALMGKGPV